MIAMKCRLKKLRTRYAPSILLLMVFCVAFGFGAWFPAAGVAAVLLLAEFAAYLLTFRGKLRISTPHGDNQPYHPSVLYFEHGWNGWKYWMAFTPYPQNAAPYDDRWENPCVVVSDNGTDWEYPGGTVCSLEELTPLQIEHRNYYSDPHLLYRPDRDEIELYFRLNEGAHCEEIRLFRRRTGNGTDWTEKEPLTCEQDGITGRKGVSPAVLYQNGYRMWFVADEGGKGPVYSARSADGLTWGNVERCELSGGETAPWHIDCQYLDGGYRLLVYDQREELTLWSSPDGTHFSFKKKMLTPSPRPGCFYNRGLYRGCLVSTGETVSMFFSAADGEQRGLGLARGTSEDTLQVASASERCREDNRKFLRDVFRKYFLFEIRIIQIAMQLIRNKIGRE